MKYFIIGTAGHVDHGKTMLVKALTGKETDRLKEEKERGISIELGFAPFQLASGNTAGIIDVPGHERFIKNMLAGVGGIDLVLLVIAADEGIMPQTREHLDIIQLLQVEKGIVVVTKIDLVDDDWLQLMHEEIKEFLQDSFLADAPVVDVSVVSGQGIEELKQLIDKITLEFKPREVVGRTRMPIDRVFSITGFGTVVTGTLMGGQVQIGDAVEILPSGTQSRVRSLQVHGQNVERAMVGQRVAINLVGVEVNDIERGSVIIEPKSLQSSYRLDAELNLLSGAAKELANRARIRVHIGTKEALGRVVLLDREELKPGETGMVQIELEEQVSSGKNDRFVIRSYSPLRTIGGGTVIDPNPRKHKRFDQLAIEALKTMQKGTPAELIDQYLQVQAKILVPLATMGKEIDNFVAMIGALPELAQAGKIRLIKLDGVDYVIPLTRYKNVTADLKVILAKFHQQYPLRVGYPKEEIRSRLFNDLTPKLFNFVLQVMLDDQIIKINDKYVSLFEFFPQPNEKQQKPIQVMQSKIKAAGFQPPGMDELINELKLSKEEADEMLFYLLGNKELLKISEGFYISSEVLTEGINKIKQFLQEKGATTLGEVRDILGTSRKYALPLLEYFDAEKITRRVEDKRVLY